VTVKTCRDGRYSLRSPADPPNNGCAHVAVKSACVFGGLSGLKILAAQSDRAPIIRLQTLAASFRSNSIVTEE